MMRNEQLVSLRPRLKLDIEQSKDREKFQNLTLRPILKFQNELLGKIFLKYVEKRKVKWENISQLEKVTFIKDKISKDQRLQQLFLGVIIGLFTNEEYVAYLKHEKEFNQRIRSMLIQRLEDQLT